MTSIVNVKVKHIRPEYNNLSDWMDDQNNEYIGRHGVIFIEKQRFPKQPSKWANPFKIGKDGDRDTVINKYKQYLKNKLDNDELLRHELLKLKNKKLGCWCYPEPCHGDVLIELIKLYENN
tara:strand:+ start:92 stop:454 length:363 start_codon:yes stop_codon:yes gene_type:complete